MAAAAFSNVIAAGGGERKRRRGTSGDAMAAPGPFDPKRQKMTAVAAATVASRPAPALPPVQQPLPLNLGWVSTALTISKSNKESNKLPSWFAFKRCGAEWNKKSCTL